MDSIVDTVRQNLIRNNYTVYLAPNRAAVAPQVCALLPPRDSVAVGGSTTLFECGVIPLLRAGGYPFWDRHAPGLTEAAREAVFEASKQADTYLCSSNAITHDGVLYNVDGHSNRISALVHGPKSVIVVAGVNKLVPTLDDAVARVKTQVAPRICRRSGLDTPCAKTGRCIATEGGAARMAEGCQSPDRRCCNQLVCGRQRHPGRVKVILVGEPLGL